MANNVFLGIDVGATGMKGGLVDIKKGKMLTERARFDTPKPATPKAMAEVYGKLVDHFDYKGHVGVGFPAVVTRNIARSAANIHESWVGTDIGKVFAKVSRNPVHALNDADAAGIATMAFGTGRNHSKRGVVLMITIGTGLGAALFMDGTLIPNFELGQVYLKNQRVIAEKYISNRVRKDNDMSWKEFGKRFNEYISHVDSIINPDLIILGGGASKKFDEYKDYLKTNAKVKAAVMENTAGTVGAAIYASLHRR